MIDIIKCPVCGKREFEAEDYSMCEVCGWFYDLLQYKDHDYVGGQNKLSVNQMRELLKAGKLEPPVLTE